MKQQSKNHSAGVSIGMVSILMIFVVLCLTTFATLSFVSARADLKLSKKASDSVSEYYAADSAAETYLAQIASQLETADSSWQQIVSLSDTSLECSVAENNALFSYSVSVNEQKNLMVVLSCPLDSNGIPSGELSVQKWQVETLANDTLQEEPVLNLASQPPLLP